ncbi:MAG: hypothetical protein QOE62_71 [Actinomycetota bacterium]|nr:hypothetical protein [Actinomycetota bacterium]
MVSRVSPDPAGLAPALVDWLRRPRSPGFSAGHEPAPGWEADPPLDELHCHPDLIARLAEAARPIAGVRRRFVAGCPVIEHPRGRPIAAAAGASWLAVRSDLPAGALGVVPMATALGPEWLQMNPWSENVAFARALDLLRAHVARAYELAGAGA